MLKIRFISAVIGIALLITVMSLGAKVLGIAVFFLSVMGVYEIYNALSKVGYNPVKILGYIACVPLFVIAVTGSSSLSDRCFGEFTLTKLIFMFVFLQVLALLMMIVFAHKEYNIVDISVTFFAIFYVVFLFSFIILTRNLDNGLIFVWLIFTGAWATDTFAYFTGKFLGRRKILPDISPKKTVAGTIGGVAGTIVVTIVYGLVLINKNLGYHLPLYHFIILGILNGTLSQVGDWAASAVKRYTKIKDYANIMPGHGGVLDRFDSTLLIAPIIYFYCTIFLK